MKTLQKALEDKLNSLGYNYTIVNSIIGKFDFNSIESKIENEEEIDNFIIVDEYEIVNVEIIELFLGILYDTFQIEVLEGDIEISSVENVFGTRMAIANYSLDKRNAIIALTTDYKFRIIIYKPNTKTQNLYKGKTYEEIFGKDRNEISKEYYDAFLKNGKLSEKRIKEILNLLISDYVIDEIAVYNSSPRIKMYDNEYLYAQNLYSYSLRYINNIANRIEILNKEADIKRTSKNVQTSLITNDPYIKLEDLKCEADFPLNTISYAWLEYNNNGQEEISIFVPNQTYNEATFAELKKSDSRISEVAIDILRKARDITSATVSEDFIIDVLKKLNFELMFPSVDIIKNHLSNRFDSIEPIKYKYKIIDDPAEFEENLYVTIEDGFAGRYSYKLVENAIEDLTTIGNKLEYTNNVGELVKKQSIPDFNVGAPTAIIRRETFIDSSKIPELLGYIYEDMKYYGTDGLPVPNIEVIFYVPRSDLRSTQVTMYNGTPLDSINKSLSKHNLYGECENISPDQNDSDNFVIGGNTLPRFNLCNC